MQLTFNDIVLDDGWPRGLKWMVVVSILLHAGVLYFALIILPDFMGRTRKLPPIYTVNLVTLPQAAAPEAKGSKAKLRSKPRPAPAPKKAKLVPLGPAKPGDKEKLKLKKIKIPPPQTKVDPNKAINRALSRVKKKVTRQEKANDHMEKAITQITRKGRTGKEGLGAESGLRGTGPVSELDSRMRDYYVVIYNIISSHWNLPPASMIGTRPELEAVYIIRIDREGRIIKRWFERRSGIKYFDQSAEKAITRSTPLPPLPEAFKDQSVEVGLRFTRAGVKRR